jgi:L-asparaginase
LVSTHGGPSFCQTASAKALPLVCVLSTGGTISGRGSSPTDLSNYRSGGVLGEDVVKGVPQISQFATVKVDRIVNVGSPDITTENWLTIANRRSAIFADPAVAGVVVTHGTSTLEETA